MTSNDNSSVEGQPLAVSRVLIESIGICLDGMESRLNIELETTAVLKSMASTALDYIQVRRNGPYQDLE